MSGTASLFARDRVVRICSVDFIGSKPALLFLLEFPPASGGCKLLKVSLTYGAFIIVIFFAYSVTF
jgi:hypothetical protein